MAWKNGHWRMTMTKTLEEQIEEAREDVRFLREVAMHWQCASDTWTRVLPRAVARLATLEAVRDGKMVEVFATVSVSPSEGWSARGMVGTRPDDSGTLEEIEHSPHDALTILRGYAHVPSTQVHEVEADSEVPS